MSKQEAFNTNFLTLKVSELYYRRNTLPNTTFSSSKQSTTRCVRLILIEFIPGLPMQDADPKSSSQSARQRITKTVVDFETMLYARDIVHPDIYLRRIPAYRSVNH
jgi:hypothetical protein